MVAGQDFDGVHFFGTTSCDLMLRDKVVTSVLLAAPYAEIGLMVADALQKQPQNVKLLLTDRDAPLEDLGTLITVREFIERFYL